MARRLHRTTHPVTMPILQPNAAGIDLGATESYVCVPLDRDPEPIRRFGAFTEDLHALADWLRQCGVTAVAMEATGVYWIPLYQILETRQFEVCLVNARHGKHVPGRKSDVQDCQWLQYLHSVGLLRASFRPPETVCAVRTLLRHRDGGGGVAPHRFKQDRRRLHANVTHLFGDHGLVFFVEDGEKELQLRQVREAKHRGLQ